MKMRHTAQLRRSHAASAVSADERRRAADERLSELRSAVLAGRLVLRTGIGIQPTFQTRA